MNPAKFDFRRLQDLDKALEGMRPDRAINCHNSVHHLWPLRSLVDLFGVTSCARVNAERLATGRRDLVVVLIEPTDEADVLPYDEMKDRSPTLRYLDEALASYGRSFEDTVILDVRPYRSAGRRDAQGEESRTAQDEVAYLVFEAMVEQLQPDVMLVCQCQTSRARNRFVAQVSSSAKRFAQTRLQTLHSGKEVIMVDSFHPMYALRSERPIDRTLREALFKLTVAMAVNAAVGRQCQGFGIINLRMAVRDSSPAIILRASGEVELTYRRMDENCVASPALLEAVKHSAPFIKHNTKQRKLRFVLDQIRDKTSRETASSPLQSLSELANALPSSE